MRRLLLAGLLCCGWTGRLDAGRRQSLTASRPLQAVLTRPGHALALRGRTLELARRHRQALTLRSSPAQLTRGLVLYAVLAQSVARNRTAVHASAVHAALLPATWLPATWLPATWLHASLLATTWLHATLLHRALLHAALLRRPGRHATLRQTALLHRALCMIPAQLTGWLPAMTRLAISGHPIGGEPIAGYPGRLHGGLHTVRLTWGSRRNGTAGRLHAAGREAGLAKLTAAGLAKLTAAGLAKLTIAGLAKLTVAEVAVPGVMRLEAAPREPALGLARGGGRRLAPAGICGEILLADRLLIADARSVTRNRAFRLTTVARLRAKARYVLGGHLLTLVPSGRGQADELGLGSLVFGCDGRSVKAGSWCVHRLVRTANLRRRGP